MRTAIIAALMVFSTSAEARMLNDADKAFIALGASAMVVTSQCGVPPIEGGLAKFGDKTGADSDNLHRNITAMLLANGNQPYERGDIDPVVSRMFIEFANMTSAEIQANKKRACKDWIEVLRKQGIIF